MYYAVKTGRNKYRFINKQALKDEIAQTAFWVILLGFFFYCIFA